ncbi:MAG TPA: 2-polyprenyl-3-methyl-6-methoxy-1,4-benzoquinone monooxygenase [Burkholderiaceae bacterium]
MEMSLVDRWLCGAEAALRTLSGGARADRPAPAAPPDPDGADRPLSPEDKRLSGALMRVNHVGEVCAQALYQAQALATRDPALRERMRGAAQEEIDHLAWTEARLAELGDRPSLLNPLWYGGAFLIGLAAGRLGDRVSLGFVVETERQVERHLAGHLARLPAGDAASRAIVEQMKRDEAAHADAALAAGGIELPAPVRAAMRAAAKVMTTTAHRL